MPNYISIPINFPYDPLIYYRLFFQNKQDDYRLGVGEVDRPDQLSVTTKNPTLIKLSQKNQS